MPPRAALWGQLWLRNCQLEVLHLQLRKDGEKVSWGLSSPVSCSVDLHHLEWLSWEMVPFNMVGQGAEQKAQWLKTLAGLTKDPGKSASYTSSRGSNVPTCIMHIHTCKQNAHTHKVKIMKSVQTDMVSQLFTQSRVWLGAKILRKLSTLAQGLILSWRRESWFQPSQ